MTVASRRPEFSSGEDEAEIWHQKVWCSGKSYGAKTMAWPPESLRPEPERGSAEDDAQYLCRHFRGRAQNALNGLASMPYCFILR